MRILHLTDLHLTAPGHALPDFWSGLDGALVRREFDALVLSGDLTQDASTARNNYADVRAFIETMLLPLLKGEDRSSVVIVPGNHDVDWSVEVGTDVPPRAPAVAGIRSDD